MRVFFRKQSDPHLGAIPHAGIQHLKMIRVRHILLSCNFKDKEVKMYSLNETKTAISIPNTVEHLRSFFNNGSTRPLKYRLQQLNGIAQFLKEKEIDIEQALFKDMGRPSLEAFTGDIATLNAEIKFAQKHLAKWMKPERVRSILAIQPGKSLIYREPYGVILIIAPWNYPIQLSLNPLVGAVAAGNCAIVKPSELVPATSALLANVLPKYIDNDCIQIIEGGVPETTALLAEKFDYIFYTGNPSVGRIVMQAAAQNLTPVTLELGGKSPCIVDQDTDLDVAARRILFGKFYNAGQTCVAPDYVLAHEKIENELIEQLTRNLKKFYGDNPQKSPDLARIINDHHYQRLIKIMNGSGEIVTGGVGNENERYISPTILRNVSVNAPIMQEEIFGPILPILKVKNIDEAIAFVNARPKPLALYIFSNNNKIKERILTKTSSGSACVNHTTLQLIVPSLPFGGVGNSGMGAYHGKTSFDTFTHKKSVLKKPISFDLPITYPPYKKSTKKWLRWLI